MVLSELSKCFSWKLNILGIVPTDISSVPPLPKMQSSLEESNWQRLVFYPTFVFSSQTFPTWLV